VLRADLDQSVSVEVSSTGVAGLESLVEKVESFGGRVEEVSPEGLMAVFGLEPIEDAARRAAHAALAIQKVAAPTDRSLTPPSGVFWCSRRSPHRRVLGSPSRRRAASRPLGETGGVATAGSAHGRSRAGHRARERGDARVPRETFRPRAVHGQPRRIGERVSARKPRANGTRARRTTHALRGPGPRARAPRSGPRPRSDTPWSGDRRRR